MTYLSAPGIQTPRQKPKDWNDTPEDIRVSYLQQTDGLMRQNLTVAEIKAREAQIYNEHFRQYGFRKPEMS